MTGIAVLGAGIFAREQHIPAINAIPSLELKAIYSRSQSTAESLLTAVDASAPKPDIYHDTPAVDDKSVSSLLARDDIQAVIVCVPILAQPALIKQALAAGKAVLSEKPIAKDVAAARDLMAWYEALPSPRPVWAVAENYRFTDAFLLGAEKMREIGGEVVTFSLNMFAFIADDSKYYNTAWRKTPEYQGGFLLDGGVHFIAALRLLLDAAAGSDSQNGNGNGNGGDIHRITARTALLQQKLAPVDTVHALLTTRAGASGTLCISFGTEYKSGFECQVVTTNGSVTTTPVSVEVSRKGQSGKQTTEVARSSGVKAEVEAFAASVSGGSVHQGQSPAEALRDLEVLQGMLESGEADGDVKVI